MNIHININMTTQATPLKSPSTIFKTKVSNTSIYRAEIIFKIEKKYTNHIFHLFKRTLIVFYHIFKRILIVFIRY
ncbi:hypothetical protein Hanom_Chr05g00413731 [Helianthus anomalus]